VILNTCGSQALVSFKKYMPPPLPYFNVYLNVAGECNDIIGTAKGSQINEKYFNKEKIILSPFTGPLITSFLHHVLLNKK
jgi:hypothetical protein